MSLNSETNVHDAPHGGSCSTTIAVLGLVAAACGDDDDDDPPGPRRRARRVRAEAPATTGAADTDRRGGRDHGGGHRRSGTTTTRLDEDRWRAAVGRAHRHRRPQGEVAEGGPDFMNGMHVAVNEINAAGGVAGRPIELRLFETGGTPEGAATAYREAGNDGDVLGSFLGASGALAIRDQSETIGLPDHHRERQRRHRHPGDPVRLLELGRKEYATSAIDYAVNKLGAETIAAIHYGTDFSSQIPDAITGRCEEVGCEVVAIEEAAADAPVDALIPQLTNMRNADPDVYYLEGLNPNVFAAARQLGIDSPIVSEQWLAVPALRDACGANCEGVTFAIHKCNVPELLQADDELLELCEQYRESFISEYDTLGRLQHLRSGRGVHVRRRCRGACSTAGEELTRDNIAAQMEMFDGSLLTTHGAIETSPESHRLTGTWTEGYIDVAIEMQDGQPTWVLAPDADPAGLHALTRPRAEPRCPASPTCPSTSSRG